MRVVATAGHVDHGKSTLLRALTGMEPDRWEEERRRGLTIDLGFVWTDLAPDLTVAFVDVPGHERFVGNMLAGAGAVQLALFVVAADDGWSAQSQEHLDILDLLGVEAALVAVTKVDAVPGRRVEEVSRDVRRRLQDTTLAGAPVLSVDGVSGRGIDALRTELVARLRAAPVADDRGLPRLWVDRSFTVGGAGTVVTGTLAWGRLATGQEVLVQPQARVCRIRGLQMLGRDADVAPPGSRVAVNLAGVDRSEVGRGHAVVGAWLGDRSVPGRDLSRWWATTRTVDAWVRALPVAEVGPAGAWHVHAGSAVTGATVHPLLGAPVRHGDSGHLRLVLDHPLALVSGDRFVLREAGRAATLGGGEVLDPDPPGRVRGPDARLARAEALDVVRAAREPASRLAALVRAAGGVRRAEPARAAVGAGPGETTAVAGDGLTAVGEFLVDATRLGDWEARVRDAATGAARGLRRPDLVAAADSAGCPADLAAAIVDRLVERGDLARAGSLYVPAARAGVLDAARERGRAELLSRLLADPFNPPPLDQAARAAGLGHEDVNALVQAGAVVPCGPVAFARRAVEDAASVLAGLPQPFSTAQAREALGTTRRYAVPLLEHLDATGVTRFDGQTRTVTLRRP